MRKLLVALVAALVVLAGHNSARAASVSPTGGITISPFLQKVDIAPTDTRQTFTITLTNNTPLTQEIELTNRDFGSLNETGGLLFEGANDYTQKYGLASWLTLEVSALVLEPGESKQVQATIDNRDSLGPGGHYGAIIASVAAISKDDGNRVSVRQELSSLVFANKTGGAKYDLSLVSIGRSGSRFNLPENVLLRFRNPGNVHVTPRGTVTVTDSRGKQIASGIVNEDSAYVLPETFRQITTALTPTSSRYTAVPGTYTITVNYRYDGFNTFVSQSVQFSYVNPYIIFLLIALLVVALRARRIIGFLRAQKPIKKSQITEDETQK